MLKKLIKRFDFGFNSDAKALMDLSGGLRLAQRGIEMPRANTGVSTRPQDPRYTTATNLTAKTWLANPAGVKQWLGFDVKIREPKMPIPFAPPPLYGLRFRVLDGAGDSFYHDGAAWSPATDDSHWNTQGDVASAIASFPVASQRIGVEINMWTTDARLTPQLLGLRFLYDAEVSESRDLLYGSLVPELEAIRCLSRAIVRKPDTSDELEIDLPALGFTTSYKLASVVAVYDHAADPNRLANLLTDFSGGVATLSQSVAEGANLWVSFEYTPTVAVQTSSEFHEVSTLPRIDITRVIESTVTAGYASEDYVLNADTGQGWKLPAPRTVNYTYQLEILSDKQYDAFAIRDALMSWAAESKVLVMRSTDEPFEMFLESDPDFSSEESSNSNMTRIMASILVTNVALFEERATPANAIQNLKLGGFGNVEITITKA